VIRFYLDEDLPYRVAIIARAQGLDVTSSQECGRNELPDETQLRLAAEEGRCLVTRNRDDFQELTLRFFENEWPHAGVLIVPRSLPNRDAARIARALVAFAQTQETDLPSYAVVWLSAELGSTA
jgi:predicted nuclease of predicted toxin-antitoxin system